MYLGLDSTWAWKLSRLQILGFYMGLHMILSLFFFFLNFC